jgi:hypothetical protein
MSPAPSPARPARLKTPFYFNELSEEIDAKICPITGLRREQAYLKAAECSMDLLLSQNDQ